jgi:type IV pilus assembly protein PilQ
MSAAKTDGGVRLARLLGLGLLCWGVACATQSAPGDPSADMTALSDVHVEQRGEMTVVSLEGIGSPLYTAMHDREASTLTLDLDGIQPGSVPEEIALVAGVVEEVAVTPMVDAAGAPFTRVELALDQDVSYQVMPEGAGLAIQVTPVDEEPALPTTLADADPAEAFTFDSEPVVEAEAAAPTLAPVADATELMGVDADADGIHLRANGRIQGSDAFALDNPTRLVVDLPGLQNTLTAAQVPVDSAAVAQVRIGEHPEKLRIVLDGTPDSDALAGWTAVPTHDGLFVGPPDVAAAAADMSPPAELPEALAEEMAADGPQAASEAQMQDAATTVSQVDYHTGAGSSRVVIVTEGPASYQLFEPDADTVVVSLLEAALVPGAEARIAPEPGGPVSLVMAFQQPEATNPEVRVVITRAQALQPLVAREGANIVISFQESAGVAQTPPAIVAGVEGDAGSTLVAGQPPASAGGQEGLDTLREGGLLDGKQYLGRRISLDFKDVDIDDVLRLIAEVSDLNIIAGDDVVGKVTLRLVDVPWDQALDVILLTKGLGFVKVGNVLRIAPQNLLQTEGEARLQERRAKEKLEDLVVKFQPVNYATVGNVSKLVQRLLSPRGTVNTDARTNTVIIKDIPSVIDESVALIKAIDTPTPQVLIEAKIVEANLDFSRELGLVWGFGVQRYNDGFDTSSGDRQDLGGRDFRVRPDPRLLDGSGELNNFVVDNPITSLPTALANLGAFVLDDKFNLEAQLQAAESTGEGKVISSPRVVTMDNREAQIQQGTAIPFQTFENGDAQLQFVDAVLLLKVKPHITADKSIIMQLEVTRNAPDDSVAAPGGAPAIAKNEAKTETLVRDGQTLVIGGIYTIQKSDRQSRVPYLHSIPVIGNLFKNTLLRDIRKELLIFVTPRIVDMPQLGS